MGFKRAFFSEKKRYVTGIFLIALLIFLCWSNHPFLIWMVLGISYILAFYEAFRLFALPIKTSFFLLALCIWIFAFFNARPLESGVFFAMFAAGFLAYKQSFTSKYLSLFFYPTLPFLCLYAIYEDFGIDALIWLIAVIAVCDTAAYFGGRLLGRTPFSPSSPNKTIEGVVIGISFAVCIGSLLGIGILHLGFWLSLLISLIVAISGVLGDLYESYLKRQAGLKDSGFILPGHGGILDRFDAILFGSVALHFLLYFFSAYKNNATIIL